MLSVHVNGQLFLEAIQDFAASSPFWRIATEHAIGVHGYRAQIQMGVGADLLSRATLLIDVNGAPQAMASHELKTTGSALQRQTCTRSYVSMLLYHQAVWPPSSLVTQKRSKSGSGKAGSTRKSTPMMSWNVWVPSSLKVYVAPGRTTAIALQSPTRTR